MDENPIDYSSDLGKVRVLIPDTDQINQDDSGEDKYIFSDAQINAFLSLYSYSEDAPSVHIKRAAADAIDALGTSEAYISKVIKTEDLLTDGAKVANALTTRAANLRQSAQREEDAIGTQAFQIVGFQPRPYDTYPVAWRGYPYGPGEF